MDDFNPDDWKRWRQEGRAFKFDAPYVPKPLDWDDSPGGNLFRLFIAEDESRFLNWVRRIATPEVVERLNRIAPVAPVEESRPHWQNSWFESLDAISLYGLIAVTKPKMYLEIGSGNSTKFARQAVTDFALDTRIVSIDRRPRASVDAICDSVIRDNLEYVDLKIFSELSDGDILFMDSSHRTFPGSDVTVFFTKILPYLPLGVLWGLHDVFLPGDYPAHWDVRMYNEQYMLMAYLLGGGRQYDMIEFPVAYLSGRKDVESLFTGNGFVKEVAANSALKGLSGACFWMRRIKAMLA